MKKINNTASICNVCLERIKAEIIEKNNKIFIKKKCKDHGVFISPHVWEDPETYKFLLNFKKFNFPSRKVLLNITNYCNLNCVFCYAKANQIDLKELNIEEIKNLDLNKFEYVFISGGEPTIKKDLFKIIKYFKKNKKKVFLLTNGIKLQNKKYVKSLKKTGVDLIILQFDSLSEKDIIHLRGTPLLKTKLKVIENLYKNNLPVYFFSIQLKQNNIINIERLLRYFIKYKRIIKGINFNTIWRIGRFKDRNWISTKEITDNCCKVLDVSKEDFLISTEFIYYLFILFSWLGNKRRYFSRCLIFLLVIFDKEKVIPITKIFNLRKMTDYIKSVFIDGKKYNLINLTFYIIFSQFLINFIKNKNFRLLILEFIKKLKFIFSRNIFLLNPFTTFNVGEFPTAEDFDYNFVDTCNLYYYSPSRKSFEPVCLNQIKFARERHPLC